ncbi:MAG: hypothetical protein FJ146_08250 [Deltaproteobacteria bacterium]|nr:hypothetical protein [Deltaproteobacteria bacterium]
MAGKALGRKILTAGMGIGNRGGTMASVELRPGDTLNIIWSSVQDTPLGVKEVESKFAYSYDELLARLKAKGRAGKSRRSGTSGARFSRVVALAANAMKKGKWSTGADIDRDEVFNKLMSRFGELDATEYGNITGNAKQSLVALYQNKNILKGNQRKDLKDAIDAIGLGDQV